MESELLEQAKKLAVSDRINLVEAIWDSVASESEDVSIPEWHMAILDKRLAEYKAEPEAGSSWEEVRARLEGLD